MKQKGFIRKNNDKNWEAGMIKMSETMCQVYALGQTYADNRAAFVAGIKSGGVFSEQESGVIADLFNQSLTESKLCASIGAPSLKATSAKEERYLSMAKQALEQRGVMTLLGGVDGTKLDPSLLFMGRSFCQIPGGPSEAVQKGGIAGATTQGIPSELATALVEASSQAAKTELCP